MEATGYRLGTPPPFQLHRENVEKTHVTLSLFLYLLLGGLCTILCLWTAGSAALRVPEHGGGHRFWAFLSASLLPPAVAATVLGVALGHDLLTPLGILLPVLVLAGTWANAVTLRGQSVALRLLHFPVFAFNTLLVGIYTVRIAQDLCGADLTVFGTAVTGAYGLLQDRVGQIGADSNPVWLHLPFLLPICLRYQWPHKIALLLSSAVSCGLLAVLVTAMPFAYTRAKSYWDANPTAVEMSPGFNVGVQVPWALRVAPLEQRQLWRQQILELGARSVTFVARPDLFEDHALLDQVEEEIAYAREQGLEIVALAMPPPELLLRPAKDVVDLGEAMAPLHWLLAEKLSPDLLVLFAGPLGQLTHFTTRPGRIDEWMEVYRLRATEVAQANSTVRVAVSLESRAPHAAEMFRRLKASESPVHVVGLSVFPGHHTMDEMEGCLDLLALWCERAPGDKPVRVLETGASPYSHGGEKGQWNFLQTVLEFCAKARNVTGATIVNLTDREMAFGLLAADGRRRYSWHRLRSLLTPPTQPPR